jgi:glucose-1-phosphate cytidylyltransferase
MMKVVILAGGMGTRLAEETDVKPKPMVEIGGRPILWHIMKHYAHFGFNEFVVALGYKGEQIKKYYIDYGKLHGDLTLKTRSGDVMRHGNGHDCDWSVELIQTGINTTTGGRIKAVAPYVRNETFLMTYGDGVADVDIKKLVAYHKSHGKLATMTVVHPAARFGHVEFDGDTVTAFTEKPQTAEGYINGGYFVFEPEFLEYLPGPIEEVQFFEREPMEKLARDKQLMAYKHTGFWQCMDTLRDKRLLEDLWDTGVAPWKVWGSGPGHE